MIIPVINPTSLADLKKKATILKNYKGLVQLDISDGKFTSWKSYANISKIKDLKMSFPLEIHFMFEHPEKYLDDLIFLKPKTIIFQIEAIKDFDLAYKKCKENNIEFSLAICPETPIETIFPYLKKLNFVLLLSVIPGPSGQGMQHFVLEKAQQIKKKNRKIKIELDGGINEQNLETVVTFGIDYLAIGSAIFNSKKPLEKIELLIQEFNTIKKQKKIK